MKKKENYSRPRIEFVVGDKDIEEVPHLNSLIIQRAIDQLGLNELMKRLNMDKHHGVEVQDIILILILFSSYGARSIKDLAEKAKHDSTLAKMLEDIDGINNKVLYYFEKNNDVQTYQTLLDEAIRSTQNIKKFRSKKEGIIAIDDSPLIKTGKDMESIETIYDHVDKRYVMGYVLMAASYADDDKFYGLNFEFRFSSEEDRAKSQEKKLKQEENIDFRKKESLVQLLEVQLARGIARSDFIEVCGQNLSASTLLYLDQQSMEWIGIASSKTAMMNTAGEKWNFEELKKKTCGNKADVVEIMGWALHFKRVVIEGYGEVDFCVALNREGIELECFVMKSASLEIKTLWIEKYFERNEPADNSKLKIALSLVQRAKDIGILAETVVADAWFMVPWFIAAILKIEGIERFISRLKSNTVLLWQDNEVCVKDLWGKIPFKKVENRSMNIGYIDVKMKNYGEMVRVVFVQELDKTGKVKGKYILVCTDTEYAPLKIVHDYKKRWKIECFFREGKQRFGLDNFHVRNLNAIHCHVTFSFISFLLLACIKQHYEVLKDFTFGQIIDSFLNALASITLKRKTLLVELTPKFLGLFGNIFNTG